MKFLPDDFNSTSVETGAEGSEGEPEGGWCWRGSAVCALFVYAGWINVGDKYDWRRTSRLVCAFWCAENFLTKLNLKTRGEEAEGVLCGFLFCIISHTGWPPTGLILTPDRRCCSLWPPGFLSSCVSGGLYFQQFVLAELFCILQNKLDLLWQLGGCHSRSSASEMQDFMPDAPHLYWLVTPY